MTIVACIAITIPLINSEKFYDCNSPKGAKIVMPPERQTCSSPEQKLAYTFETKLFCLEMNQYHGKVMFYSKPNRNKSATFSIFGKCQEIHLVLGNAKGERKKISNDNCKIAVYKMLEENDPESQFLWKLTSDINSLPNSKCDIEQSKTRK